MPRLTWTLPEVIPIVVVAIIVALALCQDRIAANVAELVADGSRKSIQSASSMTETYQSLLLQLKEASAEQDKVYIALVLEPLARYGVFLGELDDLVSKRNRKLLDYDAARTKLRRASENPSRDPLALSRVEEEEQLSRLAFEDLNDLVVKELPKAMAAYETILEAAAKASLLMLQVASQRNEKMNDRLVTKPMNEEHTRDALTRLQRLSIAH